MPVTFLEYWPEVVPYWTVGVPGEAVCHWTTISLQETALQGLKPDYIHICLELGCMKILQVQGLEFSMDPFRTANRLTAASFA